MRVSREAHSSLTLLLLLPHAQGKDGTDCGRGKFLIEEPVKGRSTAGCAALRNTWTHGEGQSSGGPCTIDGFAGTKRPDDRKFSRYEKLIRCICAVQERSKVNMALKRRPTWFRRPADLSRLAIGCRRSVSTQDWWRKLEPVAGAATLRFAGGTHHSAQRCVCSPSRSTCGLLTSTKGRRQPQWCEDRGS